VNKEQHERNLLISPSYREWWEENKERINTIMTFADYQTKFYTTPYPKELRHGQAVFNYVHSTEPEIADKLRGSAVDPFYQDRLVEVFWLAVERLYDETKQ